MEITVNGKPYSLSAGTSVSQLLQQLALNVGQVAVECNGAIVVRSAHESTILQAGDTVELVEFIGGG